MEESAQHAARRAAVQHVHVAAAVDECPVSRRYLAQRHGLSGGARGDCVSRAMAGGEYQAETEPSENSLPRQGRELTGKPGHLWWMWKSAERQLHTAAGTKACVLCVPGRE